MWTGGLCSGNPQGPAVAAQLFVAGRTRCTQIGQIQICAAQKAGQKQERQQIAGPWKPESEVNQGNPTLASI
jgi:hypothetical protein